VFVIDSHPIIRRGLAEVIDRQDRLRCCGESGEGPEARRLVESTRPDLVITEVSLRVGDGLDLIRQLKALHPSPRILVFSIHDESLFAERALRAGAHGYVCKREAIRTLLRAIRTILGGGIHVSHRMSNRLLGRLGSPNEVFDEWPLEQLTDRELQVLLLGQGLRSRDIAESLILSVKTVDTYREHLKAKLGLSSHSELVRFAVAWVLSSERGPRSAHRIKRALAEA
jgi:DNA-binding NarL/FixJ family response regulator